MVIFVSGRYSSKKSDYWIPKNFFASIFTWSHGIEIGKQCSVPKGMFIAVLTFSLLYQIKLTKIEEPVKVAYCGFLNLFKLDMCPS